MSGVVSFLGRDGGPLYDDTDYVGHIESSYSGFRKHKAGNPGIYYSPDGRLITEGDEPFTSSRGGGHGGGGRDRYRPYDRDSRSGYLDDDIGTARRDDRRRGHYDRGANSYRPAPPPLPADRKSTRRTQRRPRREVSPVRSYIDQRVYNADDHQRGPYLTSTKWPSSREESPPYKSREDFLPQRNHYYPPGASVRSEDDGLHRRLNLYSFLFLLAGVLILICAFVNVVFGAQHHYYSAFWAGIMVLVFGILGLAHKAKYGSASKNWSLMIVGIIATITSFTALACLFDTLVDQIIDLSLHGKDNFVLNYTATEWTVSLSASDETRVWVVFVADISVGILYVLSFLILLLTAYLANIYHDVNYTCTKVCEPWCAPAYFNPFLQLPMIELVAFAGILTRFVCVSTPDTKAWMNFWSPVWAAAIVIIGCVLGILACKRPDKKTRLGFAILFQLIGAVALGAAIVICMNGAVDNINTLDSGVFLEYDRQRVTASTVFYCLAVLLMVALMVFCVIMIGRLSLSACAGTSSPYKNNRSFESASYSQHSSTLHGRHRWGQPQGPSMAAVAQQQPQPPQQQQMYAAHTSPYMPYPNYFGYQQQMGQQPMNYLHARY